MDESKERKRKFSNDFREEPPVQTESHTHKTQHTRKRKRERENETRLTKLPGSIKVSLCAWLLCRRERERERERERARERKKRRRKPDLTDWFIFCFLLLLARLTVHWVRGLGMQWLMPLRQQVSLDSFYTLTSFHLQLHLQHTGTRTNIVAKVVTVAALSLKEQLVPILFVLSLLSPSIALAFAFHWPQWIPKAKRGPSCVCRHTKNEKHWP